MSFASALRETFRAAFAAEDPPSEVELFGLLRQRRFQEALNLLHQTPRLWTSKDESGHSPLHWAALGGCSAFIGPTLAAGVPIDTQASDQQTPLMWAVCGGSLAMVEALLEARADATIRDSKGATLFVVAIQQGHHPIAKLLADRGPPELRASPDHCGRTAAHWAAHMGNVSALELLEAVQVELHSQDTAGLLPLHYAALGGHGSAVGFLMDHGADVTLRSASSGSCLDIVTERHDRALQALILRCAFKQQLKHRGQAPRSPSSATVGGESSRRTGPLEVSKWAPLAAGAALCWTNAGADPEAKAKARGPEHPERFTFDIAQCHSQQELLQAIIRRTPHCDKACVWVVDYRGNPVDLLTLGGATLLPDSFPIRVHWLATGLPDQHVPAEIECSVSRHTRANPRLFGGHLLTLVPDTCRLQVWREMLQVEARDLPSSNRYHELSQQENEWTQLITSDVHRTFKGCNEVQQQCLLRILNAYAGHNASVGYCQGMNRIAGLLLLLTGCEAEEECFRMLVCLMDSLGLAGFFSEGFPLLGRCVSACNHLLEESAPELFRHFESQGTEPAMYVRQWFLTLFIDCLPLPVVVSVWDAIIRHGLFFCVRVAVALLDSMREVLLEVEDPDIADAFKVLQRGFASRGADNLWLGQLLVEYAHSFTMSTELGQA